MVLVAQTLLTFYLAAWLLLGLRDNILYPSMNGVFTAQVLALERLEKDFPADFDLIKHRRVANPRVQRALFRFIVMVEALVCLLLWGGAIALALALFGLLDAAAATTLALAGALGFTSIWCGFLIAGNHFAYWYCHDDAQNTHFQMALWGIGTMLFLCV